MSAVFLSCLRLTRWFFIALGLVCPLSQAEPIRSGSELDYPPFAEVTAGGRPDGFAVELMRAAVAAMGREVTFEVGPWHEIKRDLAGGRLDALPLVARTEERERMFDFTFPYLSMHGAIVVRQGERHIDSASDLAGKKVMVMRGDIAQEYLRTYDLSRDLVSAETLEEGLRRLAGGEGDAMVLQGLAGRRLIRELGLPLEVVGDPLPGYQEFCFAVRDGDRQLLALLNEGLAMVIADGTLERLRERWLGPYLETRSLLWRQALLIALASLLLAAGVAHLWQHTLVRRVVKRTAELGEANRHLATEIEERRQIEAELRKHREQLEALVAERTAALEERNERYELVLTAAQDGIWDWDLVSGRMGFSRAWWALRGLAQEESAGSKERWLDGIHPDDASRVQAALQAHLDGRSPVFDEEYRIACKDGRWIWVFGRGLARRDADGRVVRMAGSEHDINERRQAEQALRESEQYHRLLVEQAVDGIFVSDADGHYLDVNSAGADMLGYSREEILRLSIADVIDPSELPRIPKEIRFDGDKVRRSEWLFRRKDGSTFPGEVVARQLPDGRLQAFLRDISEWRRTEASLRAADRQKDEFLALLAHELRNPLAPIRNAVEILKADNLPSSASAMARDMIERQVAHMVRLIDDLLDVSRITRGKLQLRRERVELGSVLQQALETAQPFVEKAGHRLEVDLPARPLHLDGDPVRLSQVFLNLLNNAAKYTENGGHIRLAATAVGDRVTVSVEDDGIGIAAGDLPHLFEMFSQVGSASSRFQGGLGIGLSLARGLVEMHGGRIEAHSGGPGQGSRFTVHLPLASAKSGTIVATEQSETDGVIPPRRVLVVDDNADVRESLAQLLMIEGHTVETACDGLEAVAVAENLRPQFVLLDLGMPNLDGYGACRRIRAEAWGRGMRIVALTGWGQESDRRRTLETGFDGHLVKPVRIAELHALLADAPSV